MKFDSLDKFLNYGIFVIPEYQRGYSWTIEQLQDFISDLNDVTYIKEHYVGTITLVKSGNESINNRYKDKYDIVDGQQRITTIHLFLISLFYRISELDKSKADDDIIEYVLFKGVPLLRLNNKNDQEFFKNLLKESNINSLKNLNPSSKTQKNLLNARIFFDKYFRNISSSTKTLFQIRNHLYSKFKLNIFELEEESEVGLVFETMNDRGLPLSDIDKVKNYLIYLAHKLNDSQLAKDVNRKFGEIFSELMKIHDISQTKIENQFLKDCYIVYKGETKNLNDIHQKIKNSITQKDIYKINGIFDNNNILRQKKINEIKDFVNFLHKTAENYSILINKSFIEEEINNSLMRLDILGKIETFIPLFISILSHRSFKKEFIIPICNILEAYCIKVYVFGNKKQNTGNTAIQNLAHQVFVSKIKFNQLKDELRFLVSKNSSNISEFKKSILDKPIYEASYEQIIKLLFYDYEISLQDEQEFKYDLGNLQDYLANKKISIEHILPQTTQPGISQSAYSNTLGNLVISFSNSKLSNKDFLSKKTIYQQSNLECERELFYYSDWNDRMIKERAKKISKFILDNWKC